MALKLNHLKWSRKNKKSILYHLFSWKIWHPMQKNSEKVKKCTYVPTLAVDHPRPIFQISCTDREKKYIFRTADSKKSQKWTSRFKNSLQVRVDFFLRKCHCAFLCRSRQNQNFFYFLFWANLSKCVNNSTIDYSTRQTNFKLRSVYEVMLFLKIVFCC